MVNAFAESQGKNTDFQKTVMCVSMCLPLGWFIMYKLNTDCCLT